MPAPIKRDRARIAAERCAHIAANAPDTPTRLVAAYWHGRLDVLTEQAGFTAANVIDDNITMAINAIPGYAG